MGCRKLSPSMDNLPKFSRIEEDEKLEQLSGWIKFQPILARVNKPDECLRFLRMEATTRKRYPIARRILQKWHKLVNQRDHKELKKLW